MAGFLPESTRERQTEGGSWKNSLRLKLEMCQYECTAKWLRQGVVCQQTTDVPRILDAIQLGILDRETAARFADNNLRTEESYLIRYGRPLVVPDDQSLVRKNWKKIPRRFLTEAERRLFDGEMFRIRSESPEAFEMANRMTQADPESDQP